ncbi:unnamed protein product [Menidia menidia]|uniref:(Atlantic silverside) hypothetical protein n=1 Tax=Menidia menidia TaxID=238744 RepID=A0A8S4BEY0_9TELE|nr:unnamed protein product [Menidia menidia]
MTDRSHEAVSQQSPHTLRQRREVWTGTVGTAGKVFLPIRCYLFCAEASLVMLSCGSCHLLFSFLFQEH